ncbi:MAG TPA: hypothetical protein VMS17_14150, partial [Gemmataceae bacterium]|nr:hypothetical protein [Gemmataceae bacterium]
AVPASAANPDTALKLVPDNAAFCSIMLRNKEQVDIVANSRAWAKLWALPSVQQAWTAFQAEYNNPNGNLAALRQAVQAPDNQELIALLGDAVSDEVFCYGDDGWADLYGLYQEGYTAMQYGPLMDQLNPKPGGRSQQEAQAHAILAVLAKHPERIKVPNLIMGFKIPDAKKAEKQIARLEAFANQMAQAVPQLKGHVNRAKVGEGDFLTLTGEAAQLPWDQIQIQNFEDKPGEFAPVIDRLKSLKVTISLGVEHGYVLFAIGPSTDYLSTFGGAGPRLADRPEFKPLAEFADQKLTSIGYTSKAFMQAFVGGSVGQLDSTIDMAKAALARTDLSEEDRKSLLKTLDDLRTAAASHEGDVGAEMGFVFLTPRGYEGYSYNYGKSRGVDGSKPLTLLDHVGGAPLFAVVGRGKVSVEDYQKVAKAVGDAFPKLDKIIEGKLSGDDKKNYETAKADFLPLIQEASDTTEKLLLPALADGQIGFVIDAKWTSKQWIKALPATDKAMPMPELAIVLGVSDAESLRKAMTKYRELANEGLAKIKTWPGGEKIGDFQIPPPKTKQLRTGTLYFYPLPEEWGVDPQVSPTGGLSKDVAVLAMSNQHAEQLLASKPLKVDGGPLADKSKPLAGALYFDWAGMVDAATPWAEFAVDKILASQGGPVPAQQQQAVWGQVQTVLDVLKCFRGVTSATYLKDGVLVTHHESVFKDLEK